MVAPKLDSISLTLTADPLQHALVPDVNDVNDQERSAFNIVPHDVERNSFSVPHDVERCEQACRTISVERRTISFSVQYRAARRTTYDSFCVQHRRTQNEYP